MLNTVVQGPIIDQHNYRDLSTPTATEVGAALVVDSADSVKWDDECDMLVVGYGLAGSCATLKGAELGHMDIVLADRFQGGGTSALSGGVIYAGGGTSVQRGLGIHDTPQAVAEYLKKEVGGLFREDTVLRFCAAGPKMVDWLMERGPVFGGPVAAKKTSYPSPTDFLYYSGNEQVPEFRGSSPPAPRGHRTRPNDAAEHKSFSGELMMNALKKTIAATSAIRVLPQSSARRLIADRSGRVLGAELWEIPQGSAASKRHQRYYDLSKRVLFSILGLTRPFWRALTKIERKYARPRIVRARHGVVLSTGGFVHNHPMVAMAMPVYAMSGKAGSAGDDGSAIRLGQSVGARLGQMHLMSAWRFVNPPYSWMKGIVVSGAGERIVNEEQYGARLGDALFQKAGGKAWLVVDHDVQNAARHDLEGDDVWFFQRMPAQVAMRLAKSAPTIPALEAKIKLPPGSLVAAVETYNRATKDGYPDGMGKSRELRVPLTEPPFYAMDVSYNAKLNPVAGITLGGLDVDEDSGAVRNVQGDTIPGLYAAGRAAVGMCSANYVSGLALSDCVWSGWRAAESIATQMTSLRANEKRSLSTGRDLSQGVLAQLEARAGGSQWPRSDALSPELQAKLYQAIGPVLRAVDVNGRK